MHASIPDVISRYISYTAHAFLHQISIFRLDTLESRNKCNLLFAAPMICALKAKNRPVMLCCVIASTKISHACKL